MIRGMNSTYFFDHPDLDLERAGGKGANLARLAQAGFPVPPGFVVVTATYREFLAQHDLAALIRTQLEGLAAGDLAALEAASQAIRSAFRDQALPPELAQEIGAAYRQLGSPPVAVRSSATAEDLPDLSFAGQQDTYLNVMGEEALLQAVVNCWSSLWTARAIGYRSRNRLEQTDLALAVVVQEMVLSEVSGVLFTANPLSGLRVETVIDASFGLGEALVSGQVEPDHYVVRRNRVVSQAQIVNKQLGSKGQQEDGDWKPKVQALPDEAILELERLGQQVQELYDFPQDIEFAWAGGRFYLLQARPITSLYPLVEGMPEHPLKLMFSFGAVQGLLDPITPLGRDTLMSVLSGGARLFVPETNYHNQAVMYAAGERLWVNFSGAMSNSLGRKVAAVGLAYIEPSVKQAINSLADEPELAAPGRPRLGTLWTIARVLLPFVGRALGFLANPDKQRRRLFTHYEGFITDYRKNCQALRQAPNLDAGGRLRERRKLLLRASEYFYEGVPRFVPAIMGGMMSLNLLQHLSGAPAQGGAFAPEVLQATRGVPHNVTTEMDLALWQVAQAIRHDPAGGEHFANTPPAELARQCLAEELPPAAQQALAGFLGRYGGRGIGEIDLGQPRWADDPTHLMQVLSSYLAIENPEAAPDVVFSRGALAAEEAVQRLVEMAHSTPGGALKSRLLRFAAGRARALIGLRESPKFFAIRMMQLIRAEMLAAGQEYTALGALNQADDIFFFHIDELEELADGAERDWQALVAERRSLRQREMLRRQTPRLLLSDGRAIYEGLGAQSGEDGLSGSPVSPGVVEGRVHVVFDPRGVSLEPGEILVCPGTDPAWTPLFLAAGGLIMEVGGMMTHGSVVAREYGIPAVVGVHQATTRLQTGQRVRMDGSSGLIVMIPTQPAA